MIRNIKKLDYNVLILLFLFMIISTLLIKSATTYDEQYHNLYLKNMINYGIGFFVLVMTALWDYRLIVKISYYLYGAALLLLIAVYMFGSEYHGAKGWFELPFGFTFQPAEFMKIVLILAIVKLLEQKNYDPLRIIRDVAPMVFMTLVPFILVLKQPDLGNAIIYLVILFAMLWMGNLKYKHMFLLVTLIAASLTAFVYSYVHYHEPIEQFLLDKKLGHWSERIDTFLMPDQASDDATYHVKKTITAIGSGQLSGDGFMQGSSKNRGRIPFAYSDSIFAVIGEEFGFIGCSLLIALYLILLSKLLFMNSGASYAAGFIAVGVSAVMLFQIFENIGMLMGLMPLTGITLPFISYGGTSIMINMFSIGLILSAQIHRD
ncbi:FtsW/RodA/SpoVE family cell cycle protein [Paenibacillus sp. UNC451MF]|uniref:FtsW/RodA/SpoVE family cell cycle protein n=1 Tax=Paenibacillus sp. UNC451MF TaxID=1449063 RepID=UPI00048A61D4|nr:FtsW/RodA/SpoVE family cell cycle protein [Paenibacillus sp. UNC451MF]